ncbi:MAG: hypothetical protein SGBAC_011648, partial [Bacillariaceae sp.]
MEALPENKHSTANATSTRSSSRREREFKDGIVTVETESNSSELASTYETMQTISDYTEQSMMIQDEEQGIDSNPRESAKNATKRNKS